jgi:hypothetical protein
MNQIGIVAHHVLDENFSMRLSVPIAGVAHPTPTIMASAIRVGEHLLERTA